MSFKAGHVAIAKVREALRTGPKSTRQLQEVLGFGPHYVRAIISNLREEGCAIETEAFYTLKREPQSGESHATSDRLQNQGSD